MLSTRPPSWAHIIFGGLFIISLRAPATAKRGGALPNASAAPAVETRTAPQSQQPAKCWIFTHMQKSGGSTIKKIVQTWRGGHAFKMFDSYHWKHGDDWRKNFARKLLSNGDTIVMGGYTEALRQEAVTRDKCAWFTVVRHPVTRVVSAFFYCKNIMPTDPLCATLNMPPEAHTDVIAFAQHWGNFGLRQFAVGMVSFADVLDSINTTAMGNGAISLNTQNSELRQIAGWYLLKMYLDGRAGAAVETSESNDVMGNMLIPVQGLLRDRYAAVGILEEFNMTLSLFDAALDIPGLKWHREFAQVGLKNMDSKDKREEEEAIAMASTSAELKRYIQLDLLLYEHAVAVFHEQVQLHGVN